MVYTRVNGSPVLHWSDGLKFLSGNNNPKPTRKLLLRGFLSNRVCSDQVQTTTYHVDKNVKRTRKKRTRKKKTRKKRTRKKRTRKKRMRKKRTRKKRRRKKRRRKKRTRKKRMRVSPRKQARADGLG